MADILSFYTDIDFKDAALSVPVGVASIVKVDDPTKPDLTKLSNWYSIGQYTYDEGYYRHIYRQTINGQSGIGLGGTGAIATIFSPNNWVTGPNPKLQDGNWKNCFFIDVHDTSAFESQHVWRGIYLQIWGNQYEDNDNLWHFSPFIRIGNYRAIPDNVVSTKSERTGYKYYTGSDYEFAAEASSMSWTETSQFNQIAMYSCTIEETEFFMFVMGVNNGALHPSNGVTAMLIPKSYFKYRIPKPYVGPVTPESAAGFDPPSRDLYNDEVLPRVIPDTDPFGLNGGGGGVHLVYQSQSQYQQFINGIFNGPPVSAAPTIGGVLALERRDADQVQIMTSGVLSCKLIPKFSAIQPSPCEKKTVCGYQLGGFGDWARNLVGTYVNQISPVHVDCGYVGRTYNNFLDFEPYTTMTLHIPFLGDVAMDPSVVYGSTIELQGYVDYLTGLLSLSIVVYKNGVGHIHTTLQGNCAVDVPIIGAGSSSTQAIGKIASGLGKLASNPVNGVFNVLQGISQVGKSVPITWNAQSSLAAMFSPRTVYLTINTPLPENPENYAALMGTVVRKEGTVGRYTGYSEFSAVNLNTVNATDAEKQEIERLLKGGVFV